jgi:hypothetical protein
MSSVTGVSLRVSAIFTLQKSVCEERITAYEQKKIIKEELKAEKA